MEIPLALVASSAVYYVVSFAAIVVWRRRALKAEAMLDGIASARRFRG
jgi:hypothetical protein